jgi:CheY-specific phosphatase CheX
MHATWKTALLQAAVLTFEELCFLFPDTELTAEQRQAPIDATVCVHFRGPFEGTLQVTLCGQMLPTVAANMLGDDEPPVVTQQHDALGEIANVICGNLLPGIAAPQAVFQLDTPQLLDPAATPLTQPEDSVADVQLGLDQGRVDLRLQVEMAAANHAEDL